MDSFVRAAGSDDPIAGGRIDVATDMAPARRVERLFGRGLASCKDSACGYPRRHGCGAVQPDDMTARLATEDCASPIRAADRSPQRSQPAPAARFPAPSLDSRVSSEQRIVVSATFGADTGITGTIGRSILPRHALQPARNPILAQDDSLREPTLATGVRAAALQRYLNRFLSAYAYYRSLLNAARQDRDGPRDRRGVGAAYVYPNPVPSLRILHVRLIFIR